MSNVARSLPADDPWRSLGARIVGGGVDVVSPGPAHLIPDGTGALLPGGRQFGKSASMMDLVTPDDVDLLSDKTLAAFYDPLTEQSAALIGFATAGWRSAYRACVTIETVYHQRIDSFGVDALRWVAARRQHYEGDGDLFVLLSLLWWQERAYRLLDDISRTDYDDEIAAEIGDAEVSDGAWTMFTVT